MWLIVLNRKSGRGKAKKLSQTLISLLERNEIAYELVDESSAVKTSEKIRDLFLTGDFETLIAIGGDGLVHLCIQEIALKSIIFGVIPAGTGNDFARCIGVYGKSVAEIFEGYVSYQPKKLDLGRISSSDGLLDLILVKPVSRLTLLRIFPRVFSGRHIDHPKVNSYSGRRVQISADTSAFADGEFISPLPIEIEVVTGALNSWSLK